MYGNLAIRTTRADQIGPEPNFASAIVRYLKVLYASTRRRRWGRHYHTSVTTRYESSDQDHYEVSVEMYCTTMQYTPNLT